MAILLGKKKILRRLRKKNYAILFKKRQEVIYNWLSNIKSEKAI